MRESGTATHPADDLIVGVHLATELCKGRQVSGSGGHLADGQVPGLLTSGLRIADFDLERVLRSRVHLFERLPPRFRLCCCARAWLLLLLAGEALLRSRILALDAVPARGHIVAAAEGAVQG